MPFVSGRFLVILTTTTSVQLAAVSMAETSRVKPNEETGTIEMTDGTGKLKIRLNHRERCLLDRVVVNGRETLAATGVCTGILVDGQWVTTRDPVGNPGVEIRDNQVDVTGIGFSAGDVSVKENWHFRMEDSGIEWKIVRQYLNGGMLEDSYFPGWEFANMDTWTAGILDTGGVAWSRYIGQGASYGNHAASVDFWKAADALRIRTSTAGPSKFASRFSQQPSGAMTFAQSVTDEVLETKHELRRSVGRLDVWKPFLVKPGTVTTVLRLEAAEAGKLRYRGNLKGLDGSVVMDLLDTIGRYGVVDRAIVGGNGWLTGWVCLHEPFFAQMGLALGDPNFTANLATSLDAWRDHALQKDGRVHSRWHHDTGDNMMPGTYDPLTGYYDCGWGYLMDSQPDYVINVAEQFDLTGDLDWLRAQKEPCERALEWILKKDTDRDGLVEMMSKSHRENKASDWLDVVWASWENAFVNAKLYQALVLWSEREEILGDSAKARIYREAAGKLRESFIKTVDQGGFWHAEKGCFIYWREEDDSLHGTNFVTPVNFAAVAYGIATPAQQKIILDGAEGRMRSENLFHWPLCFESFAPGEGRDDVFPTYENGDIFLSWGELGIRSYARHDPRTAVAYVERTLDRYKKDGLSFQRYRRGSQEGAGDDILAGNSMTIVGLYRNIYGVRPQWNRMMLEPHLTAALDGTTLQYQLRGQPHLLELGITASTASAMNFSVKSTTPFGYDVTPEKVSWFSGTGSIASLEIARDKMAEVKVEILDWPDQESGARVWKEVSSGETPMLRHVRGLQPNRAYHLKTGDTVIGKIVSDINGTISFKHSAPAVETTRVFSVIPAS